MNQLIANQPTHRNNMNRPTVNQPTHQNNMLIVVKFSGRMKEDYKKEAYDFF